MVASAPTGEVGRNPTEHEPSLGYAQLGIDGEEILLSHGCWWIDEEGDYVIRSSEFDVIAGGRTFGDALVAFIGNVLDYGVYLGELGLDNLAENEEEMFHLLGPRLARVAQAVARSEAQRRRKLIPRRRERSERWHTSSRQLGSHLPSPA